MESSKTLIIGSGPCALELAEKLLNEDIGLIVLAGDDSFDFNALLSIGDNKSVEIFTAAKVTECTGGIGSYSITFSQNNHIHTRHISLIVIAEEYHRTPNFEEYGLLPASNVLSIDMLRQLKVTQKPDDSSIKGKTKIAFLTGISKESNPFILEEIIVSAIELQSSPGIQTYVFTGNLKVAGNGLEKLYRESKNTGTIYFKLTGKHPEIIQNNEDNTWMKFFDEILRRQIIFQPDIIIVDDRLSPSPGLKEISSVLRISTDDAGFLQADNIHRLPVFTNRKGILIAGPSKNIQDIDASKTDVDSIVFNVMKFYEQQVPIGETTAEINPGRCVHCLTCYRFCPHRAIKLDTHMTVIQNACEGCGLCAAECPATAIHMNPDSNDIKNLIENINLDSAASPAILVLACCRSAMRANESALHLDKKIPDGIRLFSVPCAGSVSIENIFTLFRKNADGILVISCHEGNCFSEIGNIQAKTRINSLKQKLKVIGLNENRLKMTSIASNMGAALVDELNRFKEEIDALE